MYPVIDGFYRLGDKIHGRDLTRSIKNRNYSSYYRQFNIIYEDYPFRNETYTVVRMIPHGNSMQILFLKRDTLTEALSKDNPTCLRFCLIQNNVDNKAYNTLFHIADDHVTDMSNGKKLAFRIHPYYI